MSQRTDSTDTRSGILYGLIAYGIWGLMPLYFTALKRVSSYEILAQRIVWCGVLLAIVLTLAGRWRELFSALASSKLRWMLVASALFLSANWLLYIYGVTSEQTVETSLGYFINPLVNVAMGIVVFGERLRPLQGCAIVIATLAVLNMAILGGHFPWIALTLGFSFAFYGLIRKIAPIDALVGLAVETFVLIIPAIAALIYLTVDGKLCFGRTGWTTDVLLLASSLVTAVPLICFAKAARQLRLSTLGFMQYMAPSVQFLLAITVLDERRLMTAANWASFICIWIALAFYSLDAWLHLRRPRVSHVDSETADPQPVVSQID